MAQLDLDSWVLDVRVFDLNAQRHRNLDLQKCYKRNEDEKKRTYNERVLEVKHATFTSVFTTNSGMARECKAFFKGIGTNDLRETKHYINISY